MGVGVQKNHFGLEDNDLHVFTLTDISDNRRRLGYHEMKSIIADLGMIMVTEVYYTDCFKFEEGSFENDTFNPKTDVNENTVWTFDRLQKFTDIQVYSNNTLAEGIVIRPCEPFISQKLKTLWSGKIINRDYKL